MYSIDLESGCVHWIFPADAAVRGAIAVGDGPGGRQTAFFTDFRTHTYAIDAASGELLWKYDPQVIEQAGDRLRIMWGASRGIALYEGKIYVATVDGRLIAVDQQTGEELWSTMTVDPELPLFITGAPKAFRGLVVIGNGGTENGPSRGYVTAYDAETGEQAWRFWIVPGNPADGFESEAMAMAAETWTGEWWVHGSTSSMMTIGRFSKPWPFWGTRSPWRRLRP